MILRGLPKMSSGLTCTPSMITANSASMPIAASWIRSRGDDLFSPVFFFFSCAIRITQCSSHLSISCEASSTLHIPRNRQHVPEVEVHVILGVTGGRAVRARPDSGQCLSGDQAEALDRTPVVQVGIADPVDVRGGTPGVRRRVLREPV